LIKVDDEGDQILIAKIHKAKQDQVFRHWELLDAAARRRLLDQLAQLDLSELAQRDRLRLDLLAGTRKTGRFGLLQPAEITLPPEPDQLRTLRAIGEKAIAEGKVAAFLVAGGQGSRLRWGATKGNYPIGPASGRTLFEHFARSIHARSRRAGVAIPWIIQTSSSNEAETRAILEEAHDYGLPKGSVRLIRQRDLPVVDERGRILLAAPDKLVLSPNGHGGALTALAESGTLDELAERGIEQVFYFQIDNPLCPVLDPVFLGHHLSENADMSTKVVLKTDPWEKVGVLALRGDRLGIVEYSELTETERFAQDEAGDLRFRAGNIAIHAFRMDFLRKVAADGNSLPYHLARKAVPHLGREGELVKPEEPNAIKFERFIFDVLGHARRHIGQVVDRETEFEPLKNAEGANSPETVRRALIAKYASWCEAAGMEVQRDADGQPCQVYEIDPLTALDADELKSRVAQGLELKLKDGVLSV